MRDTPPAVLFTATGSSTPNLLPRQIRVRLNREGDPVEGGGAEALFEGELDFFCGWRRLGVARLCDESVQIERMPAGLASPFDVEEHRVRSEPAAFERLERFPEAWAGSGQIPSAVSHREAFRRFERRTGEVHGQPGGEGIVGEVRELVW